MYLCVYLHLIVYSQTYTTTAESAKVKQKRNQKFIKKFQMSVGVFLNTHWKLGFYKS